MGIHTLKFAFFTYKTVKVKSNFWIWLFVMIFFVMLDLVPVITKLTSKGEYDLIIYHNYIIKLNEMKTKVATMELQRQAELEQKKKEFELQNIQSGYDTITRINDYKTKMEESNHAYNLKKLMMEHQYITEKENYERENKEREISFQTEMELKKLNEENKMNQEKIRNEQEIETMKREYLLNNKDAIIEEIKTKHQLEGIEAQNKRMSEKEQLLHQMEIDKEKIKFKESIEGMIDLIQKYTNAYNTFFHKQNEA